MSTALTAPQILRADHDVSLFRSGVGELDSWLHHRALDNQRRGASRTFVVCAGHQVLGYYALATGALAHSQAVGRVRRNMPDPLPTVILARLAVDQTLQGRGLGGDLLSDAVQRVQAIAEIAGVRAILVHAISPQAASFYRRYNFSPSPTNPMTLMITLDDARKTVADIQHAIKDGNP